MPQNFYELYQIADPVHVDAVHLRQRLMQLSRKYHPDRVVGLPDDEQTRALAMTEQINTGYQTLLDPKSRLRYYLTEHGIISTDEQYNLAPDFLMEAMETSEQIMGLRMSEDAEGLSQMQFTIEQKITDYYEKLSAEVTTHFTTATVSENVKKYYYELKYYTRQLALCIGNEAEI
jgi:Fe-S protein assembly co-chaperone HscB